MQIYREMRCKYCGKLLAKGSGYIYDAKNTTNSTDYPLDGW